MILLNIWTKINYYSWILSLKYLTSRYYLNFKNTILLLKIAKNQKFCKSKILNAEIILR